MEFWVCNTMNGRLASPRYSRAHSQTPHRAVQYVQNTAVGAFNGGSGTASVPFPSPSCPASRKWNPIWDNTFWLFNSHVWTIVLPREGWVLLIRFFVCLFCILVYFFLVRKKKKKKEENKLKQYQSIASLPALPCVVSVPRPGLANICFLP